MTNPSVNQTLTIRSMLVGVNSIEGGTIISVSPTGKKVDVLCDAGIVSFYKSPRNDKYYAKHNTFVLVF